MSDWRDIERKVAAVRLSAEAGSILAFDVPGEAMVLVFHRPTQRTVILERFGHEVLSAIGDGQARTLGDLEVRFPRLHRRRLVEILITLNEQELADFDDANDIRADARQR